MMYSHFAASDIYFPLNSLDEDVAICMFHHYLYLYFIMHTYICVYILYHISIAIIFFCLVLSSRLLVLL